MRIREFGGFLWGWASRLSTAQWLWQIFAPAGVVSLSSGFAASLADQPIWFCIVVAIAAMAGASWIFFVVADYRRQLALRKKPGIPIAFSEIRRLAWINYALTGDRANPGEPMAWNFGIATIVNTSQERSVNLDFWLHLSSGDGWDMKLPATPVDGMGRHLGRHGAAAQALARHGLEQPDYIQNPVHIPAGGAVTGVLIFLFEPFDDEMRLRIIQKMMGPGPDRLQEHLIVSDLVSGARVRLALPANYRAQ